MSLNDEAGTESAAPVSEESTPVEQSEQPSQPILGGQDAAPAEVQEGAQADAETQPVGAPEKYEPFTVAEGFSLEGDRLDQANEYAKAQGWTQEQAQSAVDMFTTFTGQQQQQTTSAYDQQQDAWLAETKADEHIGGEKFDAAVTNAKRGLNAFGGDGLGDLLAAHGLGNHPEIIRYFSKVGALVGEDNSIAAGAAAESIKPTRLNTLYPNDK